MNPSEGTMPTTESPRARPNVCRSESQTDYKRALGYQQLGVDPKNLQRVPFFAIQLKSIARAADVTRAFDLLQGSDDPDARKVSDAYLSVRASYRRLLAPEAFCLAAGVPPNRVLEIVTVIAVRRTGQTSTIVGALALPRVVEKTVKRALQDDGTRERAMLLKAMGFLPPG
jgi:hypothetical protein